MEAKVVGHNNSLDEIITILKNNNLPYQDIKLENNLFVSYRNEHGKVIGSGGLEFYSAYALLRSVAVDETQRGKSLGKEIVSDLIDRAKNKSIKEIYLLTETAHNFFLKNGFTDVAREDIPTEVKASSEFTSVCPVSATCMVYRFRV
ncbi:MAG TPA: arsenic resistance N-acetyltransferase ArsN2 [Cyclobacteriaceae bacterium]|nr:arsenic resistance N-acetyltransferase ArsN2 [Cyclobacteriaceae bacterium]